MIGVLGMCRRSAGFCSGTTAQQNLLLTVAPAIWLPLNPSITAASLLCIRKHSKA
jgi:hypothetical protein